MSIDLRLLRYAQALAEHRSFSRAAAALNIAQPSLSRGIQELEARLRLPLFVRSRAGHEPTDFGRVFLQRADEVLALVGDLEREVALARGLGTGELSVAMGPYAAESVGPLSATRFAAALPGVRLRIRMGDPAAVAQLLRARTVDLAVADTSVLEAVAEFEVVARLAPLTGYVLVRPGHPLAAQANVALADVLRYPLAQVGMLPPRGLTPLLAAVRAASAQGATAATPFPALDCPTPSFAARVVALSDTVAFAALGMVRTDLERGQVVPLPGEPWLRAEWSVVRLRTRAVSPAMLAFVEALQRAHGEVLHQEEALLARWVAPPTGAERVHGTARARGGRESPSGRRRGRR